MTVAEVLKRLRVDCAVQLRVCRRLMGRKRTLALWRECKERWIA